MRETDHVLRYGAVCRSCVGGSRPRLSRPRLVAWPIERAPEAAAKPLRQPKPGSPVRDDEPRNSRPCASDPSCRRRQRAGWHRGERRSPEARAAAVAGRRAVLLRADREEGGARRRQRLRALARAHLRLALRQRSVLPAILRARLRAAARAHPELAGLGRDHQPRRRHRHQHARGQGRRRETEIRVALADKREFDASIVAQDERTDLAVLKIEGGSGNFPYLRVRQLRRARGGRPRARDRQPVRRRARP